MLLQRRGAARRAPRQAQAGQVALTRPSLIMSPAKRTPRNGVPSAHIPRAVGYTMSRITASCSAAVSTGAGE